MIKGGVRRVQCRNAVHIPFYNCSILRIFKFAAFPRSQLCSICALFEIKMYLLPSLLHFRSKYVPFPDHLDPTERNLFSSQFVAFSGFSRRRSVLLRIILVLVSARFTACSSPWVIYPCPRRSIGPPLRSLQLCLPNSHCGPALVLKSVSSPCAHLLPFPLPGHRLVAFLLSPVGLFVPLQRICDFRNRALLGHKFAPLSRPSRSICIPADRFNPP